MTFLDAITLTKMLPCLAEPGKIIVIGKPSRSLGDALPYLAALPNALAGAINATWDHRHELTPVSSARRAPQLLDVWSLLPRTNCKECGEPTCMAFAAALLRRARKAGECLPLKKSSALVEQWGTLLALH